MIKYVYIHGKEEEVYGSSLELVNNVINNLRNQSNVKILKIVQDSFKYFCTWIRFT